MTNFEWNFNYNTKLERTQLTRTQNCLVGIASAKINNLFTLAYPADKVSIYPANSMLASPKSGSSVGFAVKMTYVYVNVLSGKGAFWVS